MTKDPRFPINKKEEFCFENFLNQKKKIMVQKKNIILDWLELNGVS